MTLWMRKKKMVLTNVEGSKSNMMIGFAKVTNKRPKINSYIEKQIKYHRKFWTKLVKESSRDIGTAQSNKRTQLLGNLIWLSHSNIPAFSAKQENSD